MTWDVITPLLEPTPGQCTWKNTFMNISHYISLHVTLSISPPSRYFGVDLGGSSHHLKTYKSLTSHGMILQVGSTSMTKSADVNQPPLRPGFGTPGGGSGTPSGHPRAAGEKTQVARWKKAMTGSWVVSMVPIWRAYFSKGLKLKPPTRSLTWKKIRKSFKVILLMVQKSGEKTSWGW